MSFGVQTYKKRKKESHSMRICQKKKVGLGIGGCGWVGGWVVEGGGDGKGERREKAI